MEVTMPKGYREHLDVLQQTLGKQRAPYFGPKYEYPEEALSLWTGYRGIEEYARDVFPVEEAANGMTWMDEGDEDGDADAMEAGGNDDLASNGQQTQHMQKQNLPTRLLHPESDFVGSC